MNTTYALRTRRPRRRWRLAALVAAAGIVAGCVAMDAATASSPHHAAPVVQVAAHHDAPHAAAATPAADKVTPGKPHHILRSLYMLHRLLHIHRIFGYHRLFWRRRYWRWFG